MIEEMGELPPPRPNKTKVWTLGDMYNWRSWRVVVLTSLAQGRLCSLTWAYQDSSREVLYK